MKTKPKQLTPIVGIFLKEEPFERRLVKQIISEKKKRVTNCIMSWRIDK